MRGGIPHPLDIEVVLDTSASMDSGCGDTVQNENGTQAISSGNSKDIDCAKDGVRRLLKSLVPCSQTVVGNCGPTTTNPALDEVGLLVFPSLSTPAGYTHDTTTPGAHTDLSLEFGCAGNLNSAPAWYAPGHDEKVTITPGGGATFTVSWGGNSTGTLTKATTTAASLQSALQPVMGAGNIVVGGNTGGPFTLTFVGALGNTNVSAVSGTNLSVGPPTNGSNPGGFPGWYFDGSEVSYSASANYQITSLSNDFKLADNSASLNSGSNIVDAVTWDACSGGSWPNNEYYGLNANGGAGTYYAGAITAAQADLAADTDPSRHAQKVIILLSDGDANRNADGSQSQENGKNPCADAVTAAQAAANAGTWVYSIAYNASTSGGCNLDHSNITPFQAMQQIARNSTTPNTPDPTRFYCDPVPQGQTCNSAASLAQVFQSIGTSLTASRLLPDGTQ